MSQDVQMKVKNEQGVWELLYPITKPEFIEGLDVPLTNTLNEAKKYTDQQMSTGGGSPDCIKREEFETTINDIRGKLDEILNPYQAPSVSLSSSNSFGTKEVGEVISSMTLTANVTKKTNNISSVRFLRDNTQIGTVTAKPSGGAHTFSYTSPVSTNSTFKVEVNDGRSTVTSQGSYSFIRPMYNGSLERDCASITSSDIISLSKTLTGKSNRTIPYTHNDKRMIFAYPSSYGTLTSIIDQNGFENINGFDTKVLLVNNNGTSDYRIYVSKDLNTITNFSMTFKF